MGGGWPGDGRWVVRDGEREMGSGRWAWEMDGGWWMMDDGVDVQLAVRVDLLLRHLRLRHLRVDQVGGHLRGPG